VDRLEALQQELELIKAMVSQLRQEVAVLKGEPRDRHMETLMRQRGFRILSHGDSPHLLLPPQASSSQTEQLYQLLRRYSFRLFLRDLIQVPQGDDYHRLNRYCSVKTAAGYVKSLTSLGIVHTTPPRRYHLIPDQVSSFGPTLEWFVCETLRREFLAPALFNVKLAHTRYGGDYDVIGLLAGTLTYVEAKSSPPRGIEQPAVDAFMKRLTEFQPDLAIFLVDTELRMLDKIVPMFNEGLGKLAPGTRKSETRRLHDEIFHIEHFVYVTNSKKGIYSNLRDCVRDFFRAQGGTKTPAPSRIRE
jgi:hypothetical protein